MKKLLLPIFTVLACTLIIAVIPTDKEWAIYDDTVRLHIIANSNKDEDQALKLKIRDAVLLKFGKELAEADSKEAAEAEIKLLLGEIEELARITASEEGYDYSVKATLTKERYGTREYEDFALPAGEYSSLKIVIGEGEGENWWCVMYPPMCLGASLENNGAVTYSKEELRLIKNDGYKVKFKILELLSKK